MRLNARHNFVVGAGGLESPRPSASRVENVPRRLFAADATGPGGVVAKAVNDDIPEGLEVTDEQTFAKRDEYFVHYKPATPEIRKGEVLGGSDGVGVLAYAV